MKANPPKNAKPAPLLSAKSLDVIEDKLVSAEMYARHASQAIDDLYEDFDYDSEHKISSVDILIEKSRTLMTEALALLDGKKPGPAGGVE